MRSSVDTCKLKVLDLFSGIGGFSLGLERTGGFETVAFCEIDKWAQKVLNKHWPSVPIYPNVRTLDHDGAIDVITGGYPCQGESTAGKRKGQDDDRWLWPPMFSLIKKYRPAWVLGENVAGHVTMGLDSVLADLESQNYKARTFIIPACALDAPHRRDRVWVVANSTGDRRQQGYKNGSRCREGNGPRQERGFGDDSGTMADTEFKRFEQVEPSVSERTESQGSASAAGDCGGARGWKGWEPEPSMGRVANGIPKRVDRLRGLGNAVVPKIPEMIGNAILIAEREYA